MLCSGRGADRGERGTLKEMEKLEMVGDGELETLLRQLL